MKPQRCSLKIAGLVIKSGFRFQPLPIFGGQNESLYNSCDNCGPGGAGPQGGGGKLGQKSDEQIAAEQQKKKNEENTYEDALKKIPDQPVKQKDPWGNIR